jgi:Sulfotransferase family
MPRLSFKRRLQRKVPRVVKSTRQWARVVASAQRPDTRLVFVVGAQRSGTRLPIEILDESPVISTYSEGTDPYFDGVLLRPLERIEALVRRSAAPVIALKPICETHRTNELLDRFPGSKAIWIFRNFEDTVNSATVKWTSGRAAVRRLARREFDAADWRAGGLTEDTLRLVSHLYHPGMSEHEANAVLWYLRNDLYFALGSGRRSDVLLVRYEDLVEGPRAHAARIYNFIGVPMPAGAFGAVHSGERRRRPFPEISAELRQLCEAVHDNLLQRYREILNAGPSAAETGATLRSSRSPLVVGISAEPNQR